MKIKGPNGIPLEVPDAVATGMITAGLATQAADKAPAKPRKQQ